MLNFISPKLCLLCTVYPQKLTKLSKIKSELAASIKTTQFQGPRVKPCINVSSTRKTTSSLKNSNCRILSSPLAQTGRTLAATCGKRNDRGEQNSHLHAGVERANKERAGSTSPCPSWINDTHLLQIQPSLSHREKRVRRKL